MLTIWRHAGVSESRVSLRRRRMRLDVGHSVAGRRVERTREAAMGMETEVVEVEVTDTRGRSSENADDDHYSRDYRKLY